MVEPVQPTSASAASKPHLRRRNVLALAGAGAAAAVLGLSSRAVASSAHTASLPWGDSNPFRLGVAAGDPLPDGFVLWTKLAPNPVAEDGFGGLDGRREYEVSWQVAEDPQFRRVVRAGAERAVPRWAYSVHAEVTGLRPDREYWYRFRIGGETSAVGRARTAPALNARLRDLTFAFASCQNYPEGYFTAYRHLAADQLDLVVHLGDYIYEGGGQGSIGRGHLPAAEVFSLTDYRIRYGQYKLDPDLQAAHASAAWVVAPDDHDVENNWAGDHSQPDSEPDQDPEVFRQRRAAAYQAYYENLPLRRTSMPQGPEMQVYRRLTFGNLMQLNVLDTRRYRTVQLPSDEGRWDESRTMLGAEQEQWLLDGLGRSRARWNVLGNQVFCFDADHVAGPETRFGTDTWGGYAAARQRLFDGVVERGVDNFVIVTGDAHRSVAADLKLDFTDEASRTVGSEFLGTSISSAGDGSDQDDLGRIWLAENPHMKFHNRQRGYQRCHVGVDTWRTDYRVVAAVSTPDSPATTRASVTVESGRPGIADVSTSDG